MRKYIIISILAGLVISFILGLYLYKLKVVNEEIAFETEYIRLHSSNVIKEASELIRETSSSENKTSPNTTIIEKKYYNSCEHITEKERKVEEKLANKTESEFQIEYIGWTIQKFTKDEVVVYKEVNDFCNEHYLLKEVEGKIVIYELDKYDEEKSVFKETGIQTKYLSEVDIENLRTGVKAYGEKELNKLLEDFE